MSWFTRETYADKPRVRSRYCPGCTVKWVSIDTACFCCGREGVEGEMPAHGSSHEDYTGPRYEGQAS